MKIGVGILFSVLICLNTNSQEIKWGTPYGLRAFVLKPGQDTQSLRQHGYASTGFGSKSFNVVDHTNPFIGYSWTTSKSVKINYREFSYSTFGVNTKEYLVRDVLEYGEGFLGIEHLNEKPYVITAKRNEDLQDLEIYLRPLSKDKSDSSKVHLGAIDRMVNRGDLVNIHYYSRICQNDRFHAFYSFRHPFKGDGIKSEVVLFDGEEMSWKSFKWDNEAIPYLKQVDFVVDENGNFAILGSSYKNPTGQAFEHYYLFYSIGGEQVKTIKLEQKSDIHKKLRINRFVQDQFYLSWVNQDVYPTRRENKKMMFQILTKDGLGIKNSILFEESFVTEFWDESSLLNRQKEVSKEKPFKDYFKWFSEPVSVQNSSGDIFLVFAVKNSQTLANPASEVESIKNLKYQFVLVKLDEDLEKKNWKTVLINDNDDVQYSRYMVYNHDPSHYFMFFEHNDFSYLLYNEESGEKDKTTRSKLLRFDSDLNSEEVWSIDGSKKKDMLIRPEYCYQKKDTLFLYASSKLQQKHGYYILK